MILCTHYTSMEIEETAADGGEGERRVVATERHIMKSSGSSDHITRDMLTVPSTSDNRPSAISRQNHNTRPGKSADLGDNLASAKRIISFWDSNAAKSMTLFKSSRKEAYEYLAAMDRLRHLMENLVVTDNSSAKLVPAQRLMEMSMVRLKVEFRRILLANVAPTMVMDDDNSSHGSRDEGSTDEEGSSGGRSRTRSSNADEICEIDMMPLDAVIDLRSIAKCMVASGYGRECVRIYGMTRHPVIEECLNRIGIDQISTSDVHKMEWGILDNKIKNWIRVMSIGVRVLFASEKRLCDEIFSGFNNVRDSCFAEVVKGPATKLLAFADSVAMSKKSSERIFRVLDIYGFLLDLMPDIDAIFSQEPCASVRMQASTIVVQLGESAQRILKKFENAVHGENSKTPLPGGTIHPLTRYAMNYLSFLSDYKEALKNVMANAPIDHIPKLALPDGLMGMFGDLDSHPDNESGSPTSALSAKLGWIITILQCKIHSKSNLYKDVALSYLFLMNNFHYIVKKVKGSKLLGLLGYGWLRKNQETVKHYAANYERAAWMKPLNCLRDEGIHVSGSASTGMSEQALKDRFKGFNFAIEEALMKHSGWMVPDMELREEIRISIAEKMIPAYRSFLGRVGKSLESGRHYEMYIKYTHEELETRLLDLFHGNSSPLSSRNPSSLSSGRSQKE